MGRKILSNNQIATLTRLMVDKIIQYEGILRRKPPKDMPDNRRTVRQESLVANIKYMKGVLKSFGELVKTGNRVEDEK